MAATSYYNDSDPVAAHVLECLIKDRVIADGVVDRRSIVDVDPKDVAGFCQVHCFAGGGLWSIAARMAGWPDDRPIWTGSCPCQGESLAGKRLGADDPRHLWPDFYRIIRAARPTIVVGEQVAAAAGTHWLDRVCSDLEDEDYAVRAVDIPACAVDAPHQRQRLFWVAMDDGFGARRKGQRGDGDYGERRPRSSGSVASADDLVFADTDGCGRAGRAQDTQRSAQRGAAAERASGLLQQNANGGGESGRGLFGPEQSRGADEERSCDQLRGSNGRSGLLTDADESFLQGQSSAGKQSQPESNASAFRNGSCWSDAEWIVSPIDGKARRAKPGIRFLVNGLPGRVDLWRIGGNAIVAPLAAEVLGALMDVLP